MILQDWAAEQFSHKREAVRWFYEVWLKATATTAITERRKRGLHSSYPTSTSPGIPHATCARCIDFIYHEAFSLFVLLVEVRGWREEAGGLVPSTEQRSVADG